VVGLAGLDFNRLSMESGPLFWRKSLRATKRPELIFWNKISTGSAWNLGHSILAEDLTCGEKTADEFLEQNFPGFHWRKSR
jgi:hypothetical protein